MMLSAIIPQPMKDNCTSRRCSRLRSNKESRSELSLIVDQTSITLFKHRKHQREPGTRARLAFNLDPAAVRLSQRLADRKPEPRSGWLLAAGAMGAVEPIEDARQVCGGNPDTR